MRTHLSIEKATEESVKVAPQILTYLTRVIMVYLKLMSEPKNWTKSVGKEEALLR